MKVKNGGRGGRPEHVSLTYSHWLCTESAAKQSGSRLHGGQDGGGRLGWRGGGGRE